MLSKFRILNLFTQRISPTITTTTATGFCTLVKSQPTLESPELPAWVMFSDNPTSPEDNDDFVIPSLAHWVDAHTHTLLDPKPKLPKQTIEHVDGEAIITVLKERYSSPELVSQPLDNNVHGFQISESFVQQILKKFSNDWVTAFGFFTWAKTQTPYMHSPELYNLMVDILGKSKEFDLMWKLVEEMKEFEEGYVTLDTMTKVIRRLAKNRKYDDAVEAFRRIGEFGVNKDITALNVLMEALVKERSVEHAQNVYLEFKSLIPLNISSFNILINGWCKVRNFEQARKLMKEMKEHGFDPNVVSYTILIDAYCHDKDFRKVDKVLEEMKGNGFSPNNVTYTIVMLALGKAGQLSKALEVYEKMKSDGIVADTPCYNSLIFILGKAGRLKDACDVFDDMPKQGVVRNMVTYNTMITIACSHSMEETALRLLKEMEENSSCKPVIETYHPLIKMCCKKKRMKVLKFLLDHMFKNDLSPDLGIYTLLVNSLCKSGKLEDACRFLEDMVLHGLTPGQNTLKLLVDALECKNMLKEKEHVEELVSRVPVEPNI